MNCRFTTIDARNSSVTRVLFVVDSFTQIALWNDMSVALHHCPGEGSGESS